MKNRIHFLLVVLILFFTLCQPAYANAGTPLMWAGMLHLVFGNLFIGIAEGLLLGFLFRLPKFTSVFMMIFANYISAWLGYLILQAVEPVIERSMTLYEIQRFIWAAYGIAFVFTVIAESPFIYIMMRESKRPIIRTIFASLVIQTLSYCGIFYWYRTASFGTLFQNATIVKTLEIQNPTATLYFLGQDKNVYQMQLNSDTPIMIFETPNKAELMKLYMQPTKTGINLCVCRLEDFYTEWETDRVVVKENVLPETCSHILDIEEHEMVEKEAIDYRPPDQQEWTFSTAFWAAEGLIVYNSNTNDYYTISLETPFAQWYVRAATVLPGDEVVFQMGPQICLYSRPTGKITLLTKGTSPVVILNSDTHKEHIENEE